MQTVLLICQALFLAYLSLFFTPWISLFLFLPLSPVISQSCSISHSLFISIFIPILSVILFLFLSLSVSIFIFTSFYINSILYPFLSSIFFLCLYIPIYLLYIPLSLPSSLSTILLFSLHSPPHRDSLSLSSSPSLTTPLSLSLPTHLSTRSYQYSQVSYTVWRNCRCAATALQLHSSDAAALRSALLCLWLLS